MMKLKDYLLMNAPDSLSSDGKTGDSTGQISSRRIVLSLVGLLLGIFFSFLITGLEKTNLKNNNQSTASGILSETAR